MAGSVSTSLNPLLMVKKKDKIPFSRLVPRKIKLQVETLVIFVRNVFNIALFRRN